MDWKGSRNSYRHPGQKERKRSFRGNQHTAEKDIAFVSTSAEKLKDKSDFEVAYDDGFNYTILCFSLVFTALQSILKCKLCDNECSFWKNHHEVWDLNYVWSALVKNSNLAVFSRNTFSAKKIRNCCMDSCMHLQWRIYIRIKNYGGWVPKSAGTL